MSVRSFANCRGRCCRRIRNSPQLLPFTFVALHPLYIGALVSTAGGLTIHKTKCRWLIEE